MGGKEPDSVLGFVTGPTVGLWFMRSVLELFKADHDVRFAADFMISMGPYIHANRNDLQRGFLDDTTRDWMFMVDNDMVFDPRDVLDMLEFADEKGPGIYSAPYAMENGNFVCGPWSTTSEAPVYHPLGMVPNEPCRIGMVGAGFTLIHREVFEAVGPEAFTSIDGKAGEDLSFCYRADKVGFTPWLYPSRPGHTKSVVMYPDKKVTNLQRGEIDLVRIDPTDKVFQRS